MGKTKDDVSSLKRCDPKLKRQPLSIRYAIAWKRNGPLHRHVGWCCLNSCLPQHFVGGGINQ